MTRRRILVIVGVLVGLFVCIQLIPVWLLQTNPPVVQEPAWDSPQTRALAQRACFDCHSNETVWTWYSRIAPASWLVTFDVVQARDEMNFSEWGRSNEDAGHIARVITRGEMPPARYLLLHPDARLSDAEKQQLIAGFEASLK